MAKDFSDSDDGDDQPLEVPIKRQAAAAAARTPRRHKSQSTIGKDGSDKQITTKNMNSNNTKTTPPLVPAADKSTNEEEEEELSSSSGNVKSRRVEDLPQSGKRLRPKIKIANPLPKKVHKKLLRNKSTKFEIVSNDSLSMSQKAQLLTGRKKREERARTWKHSRQSCPHPPGVETMNFKERMLLSNSRNRRLPAGSYLSQRAKSLI